MSGTRAMYAGVRVPNAAQGIRVDGLGHVVS